MLTFNFFLKTVYTSRSQLLPGKTVIPIFTNNIFCYLYNKFLLFHSILKKSKYYCLIKTALIIPSCPGREITLANPISVSKTAPFGNYTSSFIIFICGIFCHSHNF